MAKKIPIKKRPTKKSLCEALSGLRSKMRTVSGNCRVEDMGKILTNIDSARIMVDSIINRIEDGDFIGKLKKEDIERLNANLEETLLYFSDFEEQVKDLQEQMENCSSNVKVLNDLVVALGGKKFTAPKKTKKVVKTKKPINLLGNTTTIGDIVNSLKGWNNIVVDEDDENQIW